jgi:oxygen-independent coproporphyrinogen-3 oxidase
MSIQTLTPVALAAAAALPARPAPLTAPHVYVHVPFCGRRCAYCDFAIAVRREVPVAEYVGALAAELRTRFGEEREPWPVETLYFGGGTPSRLGGEGVARVLELMRRHVALAPDAEVTLEANPEDVTPAAISAWREAGINRLSLGGQSFDDGVLAWMRRGHSGDAIARAVEMARGGGIANFSFDLIFALAPELTRSWEADLERTLALAPPHVSLYGLTVEPATPLARMHERGTASETPEEHYEAEFLAAHDALVAAGYDHYEVSNFARPGAQSRHNSSYWHGAAYVGLGPSAHGYDGATRRWNVGAYAEWVRRTAGGADPLEGSEQLTPANRTAESVYLGLRTQVGLVLTEPELARVAPWVDAGWAVLEGPRVRLTALGWLRLDALAASLTHTRSRY